MVRKCYEYLVLISKVYCQAYDPCPVTKRAKGAGRHLIIDQIEPTFRTFDLHISV